VNLEYLQLDSRSFVTGEDRALSLLFGASSDESVEARVTVKRIAQRLATLFATLKVFWTDALRPAAQRLFIWSTALQDLRAHADGV